MQQVNISDLKKTYSIVRTLISQKDMETAGQLLDEALLHLAIKSSEGLKELQGVNIDLWKQRFWLQIELNGLLKG